MPCMEECHTVVLLHYTFISYALHGGNVILLRYIIHFICLAWENVILSFCDIIRLFHMPCMEGLSDCHFVNLSIYFISLLLYCIILKFTEEDGSWLILNKNILNWSIIDVVCSANICMHPWQVDQQQDGIYHRIFGFPTKLFDNKKALFCLWIVLFFKLNLAQIITICEPDKREPKTGIPKRKIRYVFQKSWKWACTCPC